MAETHTYLQINSRCNQKCVFCNRPPVGFESDDYPFSKIKEELDRLKRENITHRVILTGGEPTLHPKLSGIIMEAKKRGFIVEIQTNGTMFGVKELMAWRKAGLDIINFAFHSHREEISNKLRGINYGSKTIVDNIKSASQLGFELHLIHVINSVNYKDMPAMIDFVHDLDIRSGRFYLNLSIVVPDGWAWENKWIIPRMADIGPYLRKACRKCEEYKINFDISEIVPLCHVKGFETHAVSTNFRFTGLKILDDYYSGQRILDFKKPDHTVANKAPQCVECSMNEICGGFYPRLKVLYGVSDFKPRHDDPRKIVNKIRPKKRHG
ncbi:MAG: radical SAM protein [Patescibacteria group bacterium]|nr:radical SAM protein [Patescibacteria group bacterium]MCL5261987.1 radical SAM protein [Patescibacteria group bacterium]